MKKLISFLPLVCLFLNLLTAQTNIDNTDQGLITEAGKMWTFEYAPVKQWQKEYGFNATEEWLEDARLASLRLSSGCSGAFVSEDGLVMTNHHCIDGIIAGFERDGENVARDGFYANTLEEERRIKDFYVDQMVLFADVTEEVQAAISEGSTDEERVELRDKKIEEIEKRYNEEYGLHCDVVRLFNGGKFSLYGFKRYNDVRAVLFVERIVGLYGGDPDNYTFPRYCADFAFLRIYDDNGEPLKTDDYFKFDTGGPEVGEVLFAIGNPGNTNRLKTVAQLEYLRDVFYENFVWIFQNHVDMYNDLMTKYPDKAAKYQGLSFGPANIAKRWGGFQTHLKDKSLMDKKRNFENRLKESVFQNAEQKEKYGHIWEAIEQCQKELRAIEGEFYSLSISDFERAQYLVVARKLYELAEELKKPEEDRGENYKEDKIEKTKEEIFPKDFDLVLEREKLAIRINFILKKLGAEHELVKKYFYECDGGKSTDRIISSTMINDKEKVMELAGKSAEEIMNCEDTLMKFVTDTRGKFHELRDRMNEIRKTETALEDQLGKATFDVYGTTIPPDASFSLRITDGVMKGYEYNGTIAPAYTTLFGLYNRYYSHEKKYPWALPERWVKFSSEFDLSAMNNFAGTFDTAGGSSGSPVIDANHEYVGIIHDGNMEGLSGDFIYTSEKKRSIALSSQGVYEIVKDLFGAKRIASELLNSKITTD